MIDLVLPYPPSVNHYWLHTRRGLYISQKGKDYREQVFKIVSVSNAKKQHNKLNVEVYQYLPDRRKRDIDNIFKALFDALTNSQIWDDDSQIYSLSAYKIDFNQHKIKNGCIRISIKEHHECITETS